MYIYNVLKETKNVPDIKALTRTPPSQSEYLYKMKNIVNR